MKKKKNETVCCKYFYKIKIKKEEKYFEYKI
jgi:hypothetical protein